MTINMFLRDDQILPCQFLTCTEADLTMIIEPALKLLNEIQEKNNLDLSALKKVLISKTRGELPDYRKLVRSGIVLGWYQLIRRSDYLELDDLNILIPDRGKGLGSLILDRVKQESRLLKLPVKVAVQKENSRAIGLYHRHNFLSVEASDEKYLTLFYQPS